MRKNKLILFLTLILVLSSAVVPVCAWQNHKQSGHEEGKLETKFFRTIKSLLAHQDILNFKDEQIKQVKALCMSIKKELIRKNAEVEIVSIDIQSNLLENDKIDIKTMEKLIDDKYKLKKDKAKILIKAFAQIQNILTKEQRDNLKGLRCASKQGCSKCMGSSSGKSMGMCPKMKACEVMSK